MNDAIMIIIMYCCDAFQVLYVDLYDAWGSGRLRRTKGHLGCRPRKDEAIYSVKGTVYNNNKCAGSGKPALANLS